MMSVGANDQVILMPVSGEIFFGVINHMVRTDGTDHIHFARTAHGSDFSPEGFGNLHGKCAHTARGAIDQDLYLR